MAFLSNFELMTLMRHEQKEKEIVAFLVLNEVRKTSSVELLVCKHCVTLTMQKRHELIFYFFYSDKLRPIKKTCQSSESR